jgi:hypothetical protein
MRRWEVKWAQNDRGGAESKTPLIVTFILIFILGFLSYKFIPVKWRNMKFNQDIEQILNIDYTREYKQVARGGFNEYTMRDKILESAKNLKIPIKDADREVKVLWPEGVLFTVEVNYTEQISLPIYGKYDWNFHVYKEQDPHAGKASGPRTN